ncbi:transcription antitermination factor NusB [bacterium]|nr:transcription antitermination factor NusB [bacterium]
MGKIPRRQSREKVLQILYSLHFQNRDKKALPYYLKRYGESITPSLPQDSYALEMLEGIVENYEAIEDTITKYYQFVDELSFIDLAIIQISIYEFMISKQTPPKVSINEAIELSKIYSTEYSKKIINAVLDAVEKSME